MEIALAQGGFTIFSLVDALTRLTQRLNYAADRADADYKVAQLLSLCSRPEGIHNGPTSHMG